MTDSAPLAAESSNILRQWVSSVLTFSSQYNDDTWSANSIIGAPQVFPNYGDLHGAWAQGGDFESRHFIEIEFPTEVYVGQLNIYETYHAGAIVAIRLKNKELSAWKTVWESAVGPLNIDNSRIFSPELQKTLFKTNQVRLELDCSLANSYCELDAVELVGKKFLVDAVATEATLSENLAKLLESEEFSDVDFEVEGKILKAHRNILVMRSDHLRTLLGNNLGQDGSSKPVHVDKISYEGFKVLLYYLYTGNVKEDASVEIACELKRISGWYDLDDLDKKSYEFIQSKLSVENVISLFVCAHSLTPKLEDVEGISLRFIAKNFNQLLERSEFKELPQQILVAITQFYAQFHK